MASANLELVRSLYAAWERGDSTSLEWAHPEIEFVIADGPTPGSWQGLAGMAEGWRSFLSAWEEFRPEVDEYRELDDGRVLVLSRYSGRGKTSGLELGQIGTKGASLFQVKGGKVTRIVRYLNRERGLAEIGVTPQDLETANPRDPEAEASVGVVRRHIRAWSERDFERALGDIDVEVTGCYADPFSGLVTFSGRDQVLAWWERIHRSWDYLDAQVEQVLEARPDLVVVAVRFKVRGKDSGAEVEGQQQFEVWRLRDGKLVNFEFYWDRAQALEAARSAGGPKASDTGTVGVSEKSLQRTRNVRDDVSVEVGGDFVATVEIHRPPNNYIDVALVSALADAYEALEKDPACRAIVLCAEGKHFCAGAAFGQGGEDASSERLQPGIAGLGVYHGYDELRSFFEDWFSTFPFDEWEQELDDVIDCGDEVVVALTRQRGRGSASGVNVELEYAQVITFRNGKIVHAVLYTDREQALKAVGVKE